MPSADRNRDVGFPSVGEDTKPCFQRGHSESFVSPPRKGIVTNRYKSGSFALSLAACPDFRFLLCAKTRDKAIKDEAWRFVCLIIRRLCSCHRELAAIHSRLKVRLTILMFVLEWLLVTLSLKFSITTLSSLETGAQKQTPALSRIF
jgi:hypothetical protein